MSKIERLSGQHDRSKFDCGNDLLNTWLKQRAGQYERRDLAITHVYVNDDDATVLGFYALSCHAVEVDHLPSEQAKGLPRIAVPVILLGRLAVDHQYQGKQIGRRLLLDAIYRCVQLSKEVGVRAIEVHAIDDRAHSFYLKYGFTALLDSQLHLSIPMHVARTLFPPDFG